MLRGFVPAAALLSLAGCVPPPALAPATETSCTAPLKAALEVDLYFGRQTGSKREVTDAQWAQFLAEEVTPRFPDGLTVIDAAGQSRERRISAVLGRTKLVVIVVLDAPDLRAKVQDVTVAYSRRFGERTVFHVEHPVCAGM